MKRIAFALSLISTLAALQVAALAADKPATPPPLSVRFLFQPQIQLTEGGSPDATAWSKDAFLRRTRVILSGALTDRVTIFVDTDIPNFGKGGNFSGSMYIQDAYIDVLLLKDAGPVNQLHLAGGLILLPFSHNNRQSAATLNALDYHGADILFPAAAQKVWRDVGIEARGLLWNDHLDLRLGVFRGAHDSPIEGGSINPKDDPRVTGRAQYNVFDAEDAFFYGGTYLGAKKILSFGAGFDAMTGWRGFTLDAFLDYPLGPDLEVVAQANYFNYRHTEGSLLLASNGDGFDVEAGLRVKSLEPVISYEMFDPQDLAAPPFDYARNWRFGLNWWIKGHSLNLKTEYARLGTKDALGVSTSRGQVTVQAQVFY